MKFLPILLAFCSTAFAQVGLRSPGFVAGTMVPAVSGAASTLNNGLVMHLKFDETSGTRNDALSTNHWLVRVDPGYATGVFGNAALFDGSSTALTNIDTAFSTNLHQGASYGSASFALWFMPTNDAGVGTIRNLFCFSQSAVSGPELRINDTEALSFGWGRNVTAQTFVTTPSWTHVSNKWHFVYGEFNATANNITLIVSNSYLFSNTVTMGAGIIHTNGEVSGPIKWNIGAFRDSISRCFAGKIDSFSWWNRVLTISERDELWNSGSGKNYPF